MQRPRGPSRIRHPSLSISISVSLALLIALSREQLLVHALRDLRRVAIPNRPHRRNHATIPRQQHPGREMHRLLRQRPVARRRLTRRKKGKTPPRARRELDDVRQLEPPFHGEHETAVERGEPVLDAVTSKVDPVCVRHLGEDVFDGAGALEEGDGDVWGGQGIHGVLEVGYFAPCTGELHLSVRVWLRDSENAQVGGRDVILEWQHERVERRAIRRNHKVRRLFPRFVRAVKTRGVNGEKRKRSCRTPKNATHLSRYLRTYGSTASLGARKPAYQVSEPLQDRADGFPPQLRQDPLESAFGVESF